MHTMDTWTLRPCFVRSGGPGYSLELIYHNKKTKKEKLIEICNLLAKKHWWKLETENQKKGKLNQNRNKKKSKLGKG